MAEQKQYWDNSPLPLINWGEEFCPSNHEYGGRRSYMLIHYVIDGFGRFNNFKRNWSLQAGDSFVIFPDTHNLYRAAFETPWHYCWLGFNPDYRVFFERSGVTRESPVMKISCMDEIYSLFKELSPYSSSASAVEQLNNQEILHQIIKLSLRAHTESSTFEEVKKNSCRDHVLSMLNFIDENYTNPIKVADVLHFICLERSYASRLFKDYNRISIGEYLRTIRMREAGRLLKEGAAIKEAAYSCGYRDYDYFLKIFKKEYGISPDRYRRSYRNK